MPPEDLELDLEMEPEPEPESAGEAGAPEELDLDLDFDLESEPETAEEAAAGEAGESEELDLDLDFDLESEPETAEEAAAGEADESEKLDFSDFEETVMLDSPPAFDTEMTSDDSTEDLDLDLDLDLEMEDEADLEPAMPSVDKEGVSDLEDLDLEMDLDMELEMESGDEESAETPKEDEAEDVDLSDIEKMLEAGEDDFGATVNLEDAIDEAEVEKWKQQPAHDDTMDETAEIDLSNIVLDTEDVEEEEAEDVELDLDINEEVDEAAAAVSEPPKDSSDIDISEFEEFEIPDEQRETSGDFADGDIDLEFEMDDDGSPAEAQDYHRGMEAETIAFAGPLAESGGKPEEKKKEKKPKKVRPKRKGGVGKPILVVLILLVLAYAAVVILDRIDIKIPVVSDYLKQLPYVNQLMKPEAVQTGEISISNITSHFVDNEKHGKFFVIRGTAKNEFPQSRRYIKLTGTLYRTGKAVAQQESVYCGNTRSNENLQSMGLDEIKKVMDNRFGDKKSNFEVKPGQEIPFMIVFSGLPDDLEEFAIEIAGSFPIQQQ
jgi:hypothetical protein